MNKKGFTLIELLAVIVILAIIALIATPIVLNIISDTNEEADLRSADFYLDAVELSIAQATLSGENLADGVYDIKDGNICLVDLNEDGSCPLDKILEVEVKGKVPEAGTIYIKNGQIDDVSFKLSDKTIGKNYSGELVYVKTIGEVCTIASDTTVSGLTAGAKYECKVDPDKNKYTFYVLTTPSSNDSYVNLIMDQNINSDGTVAGTEGIFSYEENVYNIVKWNSESNNNTKGPVTAMQFLYNATKSWTNVEPLNYIYEDRNYQGIPDSDVSTGYISFISKNGIATITPLSGDAITIGTVSEPLRARMPIYYGEFKSDHSGKISEKGEVSDLKADNSNEYLYDNLEPEVTNSAPYGYWLLSSHSSHAYGNYGAWGLGDNGVDHFVGAAMVDDGETYGVRPVITFKK